MLRDGWREYFDHEVVVGMTGRAEPGRGRAFVGAIGRQLAAGLNLGGTVLDARKPIACPIVNHAVVIGPPGSGKSQLVDGNLLWRRGKMFVFTHSRLYEKWAAIREFHGRKVIRFA